MRLFVIIIWFNRYLKDGCAGKGGKCTFYGPVTKDILMDGCAVYI